MKQRRIATFLSVLAASALLAGCGTMDRRTAGAVGGAAVGGVVGNALGGTAATIGGAAAGAYIGSKVTDPKRRD